VQIRTSGNVQAGRIGEPCSDLRVLTFAEVIQGGCDVSEFSFAETVHAVDDAPQARDRWFVSLYDALRQMARRELRRGAGISLTPTTLLHETYLNLSQRDSLVFNDRGQFMSYAARAMRGLSVDYLRNRHTQKRGGEYRITSFPTELPEVPDEPAGQSLRIDELSDALESLEKIDARLAQCVDLKFFCGFSFVEIAQLREVSERTVQRDWDKAGLLLKRIIDERSPDYEAVP